MALSTITINFQNVVLTTGTLQILISNGSFALDPVSALSMSGTTAFSSMYVTAGAINSNVQSGTAFNATVTVAVSATGSAPVLEVGNFSGTVTVTWPTSSGLSTKPVTPRTPITLDGFVD